jgi:hypothetical protein
MKLVVARRMNRRRVSDPPSMRRAQMQRVVMPKAQRAQPEPVVQTTRIPLGPRPQSAVRWPRKSAHSATQRVQPDDAEFLEQEDPQDEQDEEQLEGTRRFQPRRFGPPAQLGPNLRVQAAKGFRAGAIELRPGLWLVSEIPESALRPEFGAVALLAPLAMTVATQALQNPEQTAALVSSASQGVQALVNSIVGPPPPVAGWPMTVGMSLPAPRTFPPREVLPRWVEPEAAGFGCDGYPLGDCPCTRRRS